MQNVVFVDSQNQQLAAATMDVPRSGDQVVLGQQVFTVSAARYFVYPNNLVHVAVLLTPNISEAALADYSKAVESSLR
jgi:hypothetical protein